MQTFKISRHLTAVCESQGTRYGFRHLATLLRDGREIATAKSCYYNRTWESYEFETVLGGLLERAGMRIDAYESKCFRSKIKHQFRADDERATDRQFKTIGAVMAMGEIFATNQKGANDWKARMLKAGLEGYGLQMPEDWDQLDEKTKQARLNAVQQQLTA